MSYYAKVFNVMIASPGDVQRERAIIREVIHEWNGIHSEDRNIVLLPVDWEHHSSPEMGNEPQQIINEQVLEKSDLLIGVFWTRIGTPTSEYASGTVEEIEEQIKKGKLTMLYFSSNKVNPKDINSEQYNKVIKFKNEKRNRGLYEEYNTIEEFRKKVTNQLQMKINNHSLFNIENNNIDADNAKATTGLSEEAKMLLKECSVDGFGEILVSNDFLGKVIRTVDKIFSNWENPREIAKWEAVLKELIEIEAIDDVEKNGERYTLTNMGYQLADTIEI